MCHTQLSLLRHRSSNPCSLSPDFPLERKRLRKIFKVPPIQDLSRRCNLPVPGIDLLEFLKFTEVPGLLGEQFFTAFDIDDDGMLDEIEFVSGFLKLFKGSESETLCLLFSLMDFNRKGFVTYLDMRLILTYLPETCLKCGGRAKRTWNVEEKIAACFADQTVITIQNAEQVLNSHEDLLSDLLEALLNSLPLIFDEAMGRTKRSSCGEIECSPQTETSFRLRPLKFEGRRGFYELRNDAIYGYRGLDSQNLKRLILLKDLFVNPIDASAFELKNCVVTYTFEADSPQDRDEWVESIQSAKRFRWFDDFYETKEKLGCGAYGQVLKAVSRQTGQVAAVKIISKETMTPKLESRLRKEIRILQFVKHPNVLRLIDVFETCERIYLVTELVDGGTLYEWLEDKNFQVSEEFSRKLVEDVARGLMFLHENGIVHRDLKLENIMLKSEPNGGFRAILIDFGLSCFLGPSQQASEAVGTLKYVAPEVISRINYREKADSWSLGVVLYILLLGKVPFYGKSDQEIALRILKHKIKFTGERWQHVNPLAIDVVSGLITRKVENRWSLDEVLASAWISQHSEGLDEFEEGTVKIPLESERIETMVEVQRPITYRCPDCPAVFSSQPAVDSHTRGSHTQVLLSCSLCRLPFKDATHLKQHMFTHGVGQERPRNECQVCTAFFPDRWRLERHMKVHEKRTDPNAPPYRPRRRRSGRTCAMAPIGEVHAVSREFTPVTPRASISQSQFLQNYQRSLDSGNAGPLNFYCGICGEAMMESKFESHALIHYHDVFEARADTTAAGESATNAADCSTCQKLFKKVRAIAEILDDRYCETYEARSDPDLYSSLPADTPSRLKVMKLSEKLQNLQTGLEEEKEARMNSYQHKVKGLQDRMSRLQVADETRLANMKEQISQVQESLGTERVARELLDERKSKETKLVANNFQIDLSGERQSRKESEAKLNKLIDEKLFSIRLDLGNEKKIREESGEQKLRDLGERLASLQEEVEMERQTREEQYEMILNKISESINLFYQQLAQEKKVQEDLNAGLLQGVEQMTAAVRVEIAKERRNRETTEETLIKLLEETCLRVEQGLTYKSYY